MVFGIAKKKTFCSGISTSARFRERTAIVFDISSVSRIGTGRDLLPGTEIISILARITQIENMIIYANIEILSIKMLQITAPISTK